MTKIYSLKSFFYGLILALTIFIVFAIFSGLKIDYSYITWPTTWLMTMGLVWYFVQFLKIKKMPDFFPFGIFWIAISLLIHYLITYKFVGLALFKNFEIWINYSLILLIGFASIKFNLKK